MSAMSVGPPEDYFEDAVGVDDAAMPTRPSERGAWRHHWDDKDQENEDEATERLGANRSPHR
jgi:hypothetical protein